MAKIAHKIPEKCAIFHIIIFSDITTAIVSPFNPLSIDISFVNKSQLSAVKI